MFYIAFALLSGWILNLFGFDNTVIHGMAEVFNVKMSSTGYYFLFGLMGMLQSIFASTRNPIKVNQKKSVKEKS